MGVDPVLESMEVFGVDEFGDSAVVVEARLKAVPIEPWSVGPPVPASARQRVRPTRHRNSVLHQTLQFDELVAFGLCAEVAWPLPGFDFDNSGVWPFVAWIDLLE